MIFIKKITVFALVVLLALSTGACSSKENTKESNSLTKEAVQSVVASKDIAKNVAGESKSFDNYIKLIGLSKKELISMFKEEPTVVDEGGLEFPKEGIRVWFKDYGAGPVQQVFTTKKDVEFNGAKIGDKIGSFKSAFKKIVKEDVNSAYSNFEYEEIILSVYYDSKTEITFAVYILDKEVK